MKQYLASKLQEYIKILRTNEENYVNKYQELGGDMNKFSTTSLRGDNSTRVNTLMSSDPQLFLQNDTSKEILKKRDYEINNLLNSINELQTIFHDLQTLVFEQGTILDRIDFNIDTAIKSQEIGNKELVKSEEMLKNNCARNSIMFLIFTILILAVLLVIKFLK